MSERRKPSIDDIVRLSVETTTNADSQPIYRYVFSTAWQIEETNE